MNDQRPPFELDPFVLPAETKGRFRMLVAAALVFAWSLSAWFVHVPNLYTQVSRVEPEVQEALDKLRNGAPITREDVEVVGESASAKRFMRVILSQAARIVLSFVFLAAFGLGTWALYSLHPVLLRRRHKTHPLTAPNAVEEIRRLAALAGLSSDLRLERKTGGLIDGVAFGRRGREVLAVAGSPQILERPWNDFTRAVALHEMGHVVNDDVRGRELTRAMWVVLPSLVVLAVVVLGVVSLAHGEVRFPVFQPTAPASEGTDDSASLVTAGLKTAVTFLVIWWIWAGLIRAREHYADYRVATWGFKAPLLLLLGLREAHQRWWQRLRLWKLWSGRYQDSPWWRQGRSLWESYGWRRHPSKAARIRALREPAALFRVSPDLAFLTGLLLAFLGAQLTPLSTDLTFLATLFATPLYFLVGPLALLVFVGIALGVMLAVTWLVTGALGVQVQREAVADLATRPHHEWDYLGLGKTALFLAVGLEVGLFVSPFGFFTTARSPLWVAGWLVALAGLVGIWLLYLRAATRLLLGSQTGPSLPKWSRRWLTGSATVLLTALLWPALAFRLTIEVGGKDSLLSVLTPVNSNPSEIFAYIFAMTSLVLFFCGLVLYILLLSLCVLGAAIRLYRQRAFCTKCGEATAAKLVVGRRCAGCGAALAEWLFL